MTVTEYLLAVVLAVSGGRLTIDKGLIDGVRAGDRGQLCYSLTVNDDEKKLIQLADCEVLEVDDQSAVVRPLEPAQVRKGFFVKLSLPLERTSPASLIGIGRKRLEEGKFDSALTYFRRIKRALPNDPLVDSLVAETEKRQGQQAEALKQRQEEIERRKTMVLVKGGTFHIGVDLPEARFYNQQPRFRAELNSFWIDTAASNLLGYSYAEAEKYCQERGKRLPTEFELEIGSRQHGFRVSANAEWTASWYLPYPGNNMREEEYGEKYRVVRGPGDMRTRTFLLPTERAVDTSFRCACDP